MIQIKHRDLDKYANEHYEAISSYMGEKKVLRWNNKIKNAFSDSYDLKQLILAKPYELRELKILFSGNKEEYKLFKTYYSYLNIYKEPKFFIKKDDKETSYNAYKLVKKLNVSTCPYCNRNTIYNLEKSNGRTSEIDHFYPKEKYPYFAISFYNLIPSCKVCNKLKMEEEINIHPYEESFNEHFKFIVEKTKFYHSIDGFKLELKSEDIEVQKQIDTFKLDDLYQNHKDIILELIQKQAIYNDSYIDELFNQYEGTLFKNREDLQRLITCGYISDDEISKRPLSKLIKDISKELELI